MAAARRGLIWWMVGSRACITLCDSMFALAIPWIVLSATGSVLWTGTVASVALVALLAGSLVSPWLVRRLGPEPVIQISFAANMAGMALIGYCVAVQGLPVALLILAIVIERITDLTGNVAIESRFPELARHGGVPLPKLNAIKESLMTGAMIVGPALAGVMLAVFDPVVTVVVATAFYAAGIAFFQPVRAVYRRGPGASASAPSIFGTLSWLWQRRHLRSFIILLVLVMASISSIDDVILPALIDATTQNPADIGWVLATYGIAAVISAMAYARFHDRVPDALVTRIGIAGVALFFAGLAMPISVGPFLAVTFVAGLLSGALGPIIDTRFLTDTPASRRLPMLAALGVLAIGAAPLMVVLHAAMIDRFGVEPLAAAIAGLLLLSLLLPLDRRA